jgi:hypothetical protein
MVAIKYLLDLLGCDFFDFSVLIMKTHPKLTIYEVLSQYMPIFSVWATTNIGSIFSPVAANI